MYAWKIFWHFVLYFRGVGGPTSGCVSPCQHTSFEKYGTSAMGIYFNMHSANSVANLNSDCMHHFPLLLAFSSQVLTVGSSSDTRSYHLNGVTCLEMGSKEFFKHEHEGNNGKGCFWQQITTTSSTSTTTTTSLQLGSTPKYRIWRVRQTIENDAYCTWSKLKPLVLHLVETGR